MSGRTIAGVAAIAAVTAGCGGHRAPPADPLPPAGATQAIPGDAGAAKPHAEPMDEDQPPPGVFHLVLPGQTLFTIARTYGASLEEIATANGLEDPARIEAGLLLWVPGAARTLAVPITVPKPPGIAPSFRFPVRGTLSSRFGPRNGRMHYGIDIGAPAGSQVRAARDGVVLYAGNTYRGYGKLVIVEHDDGFRTLYAHNRRLRTHRGQEVRAGEVIAEVGATGNATGPHLHFEIRMRDAPLDPLPYLDDARRIRGGS